MKGLIVPYYAEPSAGLANLDVNVGSFTTDAASAGNQTIPHGLASTPKVLIFYGNQLSTDGSGSTNATIVFGVGISSSERRAISTASINAQTPSSNSNAQQNTRCIYYAGAARGADLVSIDATNFVINWPASMGTNYIINFIALGGDALTGYKLGALTAKTSTGTQGYTGVGFQPDALITFAGKWSTPETFDSASNGTGLLSFARSSSERAYLAWRSRNSANPSVTRHRQSKTKVAGSLSDSGIFTEADFVSFNSDGFTWDYTTAGGSADIAYYLALKGPQFKVGTLVQPTVTGVQSVSVGFPPKGLILMGANDIAANDDATNLEQEISFGAASASNKRGGIWWGDTNNVSTTVTRLNLDRAKVIKMISVGTTPTVNAAADLQGFTSDAFELNWTTVDATQREIIYLAMG